MRSAELPDQSRRYDVVLTAQFAHVTGPARTFHDSVACQLNRLRDGYFRADCSHPLPQPARR